MKDLDESRKLVYPSQERMLTGGSRFEEGDTLFARITPCLENGKICKVKGLRDGLGFGSTEFLVFRAKPGVSNSDFVYYLAKSPTVRRYAEQNMTGTSGRQRVSKEVFDQLQLHLPDLPTQNAIAEILSSLDDKIELNNQINQNLEALAQAIFKRWFVDFEFPDENGQPYKSSGGEMVESELGEIPKGWEISKIGEVLETTSGGTPSRQKEEYYQNGSIPWVKSKELNNSLILDTEEKITEAALKNSSAKHLPKSTVLIAMYGATVGQFGLTCIPCSCNQAICAILPSDRIPYSFVYFFVKNYSTQLANLAVGSAQQNISQQLIKNIKLVVPDQKVLTMFHLAARDILCSIEGHIQENRTLSRMRDTILPRLVSGELSVRKPRRIKITSSAQSTV